MDWFILRKKNENENDEKEIEKEKEKEIEEIDEIEKEKINKKLINKWVPFNPITLKIKQDEQYVARVENTIKLYKLEKEKDNYKTLNFFIGNKLDDLDKQIIILKNKLHIYHEPQYNINLDYYKKACGILGLYIGLKLIYIIVNEKIKS